MEGGLGAAFAGIVLFAVLVTVATILVVITVVAFYWPQRREQPSIRFVAITLVGVAIAIAGVASIAFVDEAPLLSVLFGTVVGLPLVLVAGRTRSVGSSWATVAVISGLAWSPPFLVCVGLLFALQTTTDVSASVLTGVGGAVTCGGAILIGEYIRNVLTAEEPVQV
ncbi:hypothetical protein [Natrinema halophilum]|uniref:Uncharacterized protein n=1 Tax=Natrinema halophilum TaxID=1699371 RepID=A0A7D5GG66_9EURY|nr:hypothetical protein [Natrinema halophilum]QLG48108.1 hypothetical protein HYG82_04225 [Natrinema halophilum]